jgi:hypothetical protein
VPDHSVHPDREELAAWQAGALAGPARTGVVAHLAGCAECTAVVSAVDRARAALASLEKEPELPPGLRERVAAAVQREAAALAQERETATTGGRVVRPRRMRRWHGRVAALSAAAALVLLVAGLVVPALRHVSGGAGAGGMAGATASRSEGAPGAATPQAAPSALPVFDAPGDYSGSALRAAVAGDPRVRDAYAHAGTVALGASSGASGGAGPPAGSAAPGGASSNATRPDFQSEGRASGKDAAAGIDQRACIAQVSAQASEDLRPAFLVQTVYQGRPATVLVTRSADAPGLAKLWAFPRGDCSSAPFARERVSVPPP